MNPPCEVLLFGDADVQADEPVCVIDYTLVWRYPIVEGVEIRVVEEVRRCVVICDFTECGMYVGGNTIRRLRERGVKIRVREGRLAEFLRELPDSVPVRAWNNGKALWLMGRGIKTVGKLKRALGIN